MIPTRAQRTYLKVCLIIVVFTLFVGFLVAMNWTGTTTRRPVSVIAESLKTATTDLLHTSSRTSENYHPLTKRNVNEVEKFLLFIGYPRSGHSIVGSLIDAHPNIILSADYYLFRELADPKHAPMNKSELFETIHKKSFEYSTVSTIKHSSKGYTLNVPGGWSGIFEGSLRVIGDRSARPATTAFNANGASEFKRVYKGLKSTVQVPLLAIHVVRNPFDMIATHTLYLLNTDKHAKADYTVENKLDNSKLLNEITRTYFNLAHAVLEMVPLCNMTVLEIHNEDLVRNPAATVTRMCEFMGVDCSSQYLDACVKKVFPEVSRTRDRVKWSSSLRRWIEEEMLKYPFFHRYSFDS